MARQPEGRRDRAKAWQDQGTWRKSKNCQHCIINKAERTGREGRRESTENMASPSQDIKPAEQRGGWKSDVKYTNTEMIPTESSCHSAPL